MSTNYQAMHAQLLDMLGAKDHEDAARIIAGHHARELTRQPEVSEEDVEIALHAYLDDPYEFVDESDAEACRIGLRRVLAAVSRNRLAQGEAMRDDPRAESGNAEEIAQWLYANGYHVAAYTIRNQLDIRNSRIRELEAQEKSEPVDDVDSPAGTLGGNTPPVGVSIRCRKCGEMTDVSFNYGHAIDGCCNQSPCSRPGVGPCTRPAERIKVPDGMCLVAREDANNYCRILTLLGMEEEGDPVAEIETLLAERVRVPDGDPMEALREERLTLLNGFGQGAFADGRLRERIAEIDAMLSAAPEGGYHG